jgi:hypothetical protein
VLIIARVWIQNAGGKLEIGRVRSNLHAPHPAAIANLAKDADGHIDP